LEEVMVEAEVEVAVVEMLVRKRRSSMKRDMANP
jgi:hypothetical protein